MEETRGFYLQFERGLFYSALTDKLDNLLMNAFSEGNFLLN